MRPRDQHVHDLTVLIDGPVEVGLAAGDLDAGRIDQPAVKPVVCAGPRPAASMNAGVKAYKPPAHRHVVDPDAALGRS